MGKFVSFKHAKSEHEVRIRGGYQEVTTFLGEDGDLVFTEAEYSNVQIVNTLEEEIRGVKEQIEALRKEMQWTEVKVIPKENKGARQRSVEVYDPLRIVDGKIDYIERRKPFIMNIRGPITANAWDKEGRAVFLEEEIEELNIKGYVK